MQGTERRLRATRANPPGLASAEGPRRETYGAALQQFDDLMAAAGAIGPVSRPLPLYYAVLQAGKAIAAAWTPGDGWSAGGHGLTEDWPAKGTSEPPAWHDDILRFRVVPHRSWPGVFAAVAAKLGTARLTGSVELGALWSALPEVTPPLQPAPWPLALPVYPHSWASEILPFQSPPYSGLVDLRGQAWPEDAAGISSLLAMYPDSAEATAPDSAGAFLIHPAAQGPVITVQWPVPDVRPGERPSEVLAAARVTSRIPLYRRTGDHWLIPMVGDKQDHLPPVLLWWVLLHGLSLLARYQPAAWRQALDLDNSPCADPLTTLLDEALEIVPDLLYDVATLPPESSQLA
jgi:hypothetical protein